MSDDVDAESIAAAAEAIAAGELVVYPTETVYGLAGDATDPDAVERVFEAKGRSRDKPLSMAVPDVGTALAYTCPTEREEQFMREFLPGPVTVVVDRWEMLPDGLTAGKPKVGIRIPDHPIALALLEAAGAVTATSANISGTPSATTVDELDDSAEAAAVVLDGGGTDGGTGSTVLDVAAGDIIRRGAEADAVEAWLAEH